MSSFSYEDLVLSSQFERVMNSRPSSQSVTQSPPQRSNYLSIQTPSRSQLTVTQSNPTNNMQESATARSFDLELPEQPTRSRSQTVQPSSVHPNAAAHAHFLQYGHHLPQAGHRRSNNQALSQTSHYTILSNHPAVQTRLRVIWNTLVSHSQSHSPSSTPKINQPIPEYCQYDDFHRFYVRLTGVLLTPHYHAGLTQANSEADWLSISKLHTMEPVSPHAGNSPSSQNRSIRILQRERFIRWLFDTTSMYVHLTDCAQFVFTLNKMYRGLTRFDSTSATSVPVSFAAMNELPLLPMNDWTHSVQDCELYMRAVCERCQWPLNNDGIDFSMPLLPMMRVEKITEQMAQSAIRIIRAGESHFGVCQGPNREGFAFSIAAMPPGYDALTEIAGLGSHLPDFWSPRHTLTRMNSTPEHLDDITDNTTLKNTSDDQKDAEMDDQSSEEWAPQLRDRARSMITPPQPQSNTIIPIARRPSMPNAHHTITVNGPIQPRWIHR